MLKKAQQSITPIIVIDCHHVAKINDGDNNGDDEERNHLIVVSLNKFASVALIIIKSMLCIAWGIR